MLKPLLGCRLPSSLAYRRRDEAELAVPCAETHSLAMTPSKESGLQTYRLVLNKDQDVWTSKISGSRQLGGRLFMQKFEAYLDLIWQILISHDIDNECHSIPVTNNQI